MNPGFAFDHPDTALRALADRLRPLTETVEATDPLGMVIAESILADRDSPAADVSAMDGYAIRLEDLQADQAVRVSGESKAGSPPPKMEAGKVVRIFTGAIVPEGCEAVVKREDTLEASGEIRFGEAALQSTQPGLHIRRAGENAAAGSEIFAPGFEMTPGAAAGLANFGVLRPRVFRPVRVAIFTTGDEVLEPDAPSLLPWQLRNSNRCSVEAVVKRVKFSEVTRSTHLPDNRESLESALVDAIEDCDAVVLTGGVSKGDYDYVPECVAAAGGEVVFHGLPIRPGKPILGAATTDGKLILGLPGNPVSATINAHRFLLALLRRISGQQRWFHEPPLVNWLSRRPKRSRCTPCRWWKLPGSAKHVCCRARARRSRCIGEKRGIRQRHARRDFRRSMAVLSLVTCKKKGGTLISYCRSAFSPYQLIAPEL